MGYHGNNAPQCEAQADTVVLKVAVVNQDEGRLEEGEEDQCGLWKEGGREGERERRRQGNILQVHTRLCSRYPTCWATALFPLNSTQLVYTKMAVK